MRRSPRFPRRARLVIGTLVLVLVAAACGGDEPAADDPAPDTDDTAAEEDTDDAAADDDAQDDAPSGDDPYTIGVVVPLSGTNQVYGDAYRVAIDMCAEFVNDEMDLANEIEIVYADGEALPAPSVTAMNRVVNVDDAIAVLTGFSAPTQALAPIANREQVPLFNGGASSPELQGLGDYVFNNIPLADQQIPATAQYAVDELGLERWLVLYSSETLGLSVRDAILDSLPEAGGEVVETVEISSEATDFGSQIARIRQVEPDLVFIATTSGGQVPTMIRQMRDAGVESRLASYAGIDIPETIAEPGAQGMLFTSQGIDYDLDQQPTRYFADEFAERYPDETPTILQANYCSQVHMIATAITSLEADGTDVTGESLMQEFRDIAAFDVVGGEVVFLEDGTVDLPINVREIQDGELNVVFNYLPGS